MKSLVLYLVLLVCVVSSKMMLISSVPLAKLWRKSSAFSISLIMFMVSSVSVSSWSFQLDLPISLVMTLCGIKLRVLSPKPWIDLVSPGRKTQVMVLSMDLRLILRFMMPLRDLINAVLFSLISNFLSDLTWNIKLRKQVIPPKTHHLKSLIRAATNTLTTISIQLPQIVIALLEMRKAKNQVSVVNTIPKMIMMRKISPGKSTHLKLDLPVPSSFTEPS